MFTFLGSTSSVIFPISTTNANSNKKILHVNHTTKTHEIFRMNLEYPQKDYTATRNDIHRRIAQCERRARIRCYAPRSPRKHHANALDGVVRWCKTTADVCKRDCTVIRAYIQMDVMFWESCNRIVLPNHKEKTLIMQSTCYHTPRALLLEPRQPHRVAHIYK
jgi:hypothetical protein